MVSGSEPENEATTLTCVITYFVCITNTLFRPVMLCCYRTIALYLQDGTTPLYIACWNGHLPVVECLIVAKADVNTAREVSYFTTT